MPQRPRTWLELSGSSLRHNFRAVQTLIGSDVLIMPIIKANAYGHGVAPIVKTLGRLPSAFGVAYGSEALAVRRLTTARIVVLSYWEANELPEMIRKNIEFVVWDASSLSAVRRLPPALRTRAQIHVKIDTGTTRIGWTADAVRRLPSRFRDLNVVGIFSHLANAEERSADRTRDQIKRFATLSTPWASEQGITRHLACTAAALRYPEAKFDLIRLGIGLYGLWPSTATQAELRAKNRGFNLQPALSWYSQLSQVKTVPAGTSIGYGATVITKRTTKVGVIPVGYADGYDRRLSNRGWVMIRGQRVPILGRICMNLMMVDVTHVRTIRVGDVVTLLGPGISAETMADLIGTIHYEVTTRIHGDIPRILVR